MHRTSALSKLLAASVALISLSAVEAQAQDAGQTDDDAHWRLFVGDHAEGVVRAYELEDGTSAGTFEVDMTPALTRSASGRTILAVQGDVGKAAVIATGIDIEDHGDHADLHVEDARLLPTVIEQARPSYVVEQGGTIALFDDGTGDVALFPEAQLLDGAFAPRVLASGAPHHGLAAPMGAFTVVSVPHEDPEQPRVGLRVLDGEGQQVGEVVDCPGVHGQASSAGTFAFGCKDGIVVATPGSGSEAPTLAHIPTASLGEGNVSTLKGGTAMQVFLGNYGPSAVVVIDTSAGEPFRKIDLSTRRIDFALDPAQPASAYILTEDGQIHRLNVLSGEIEASTQLTEPYSMDGHWRDPRPRLAVAGAHLAVTDPLQGLVRIVSTDTLEEERTIPVEGTPYTIVAVGGSGATH